MSATPTKAFFIGAGVVTVSVKAWVFTFAAIGVIGSADMGRIGHMTSYIAFVLLATSGNLIIIGAAAVFGDRSRAVLDRVLRWLQDKNRPIVVLVGLVFGIWFGLKALRGFGIL